MLQIVRDTNDAVGTFKNKDRDAVQSLRKTLEARRKELDARKKELKDQNAAQDLGDRVKELEKAIKKDAARLRSLEDRARANADKGEIDRQTFTNPTWKLEFDYFLGLCQTGGTNLVNDLWIAARIGELADQIEA